MQVEYVCDTNEIISLLSLTTTLLPNPNVYIVYNKQKVHRKNGNSTDIE